MNVTACLVTNKADPLHMQPVIDSLPEAWEKIIWNNAGPWVIGHGSFGSRIDTSGWPSPGSSDLSVYGRYAAIEYASHDLIYVQDDDVIVSDPQAVVDEWILMRSPGVDPAWNGVVCNMPPEFRPHYPDSALVGFGACFQRNKPKKAFDRMLRAGIDFGLESLDAGLGSPDRWMFRECDRVFTCLTPRILVDVPKQDREFASDPDRLWKQSGHHESTARMLDLARKVRDAT